MPDNRDDPGPLDGQLISITEPYEFERWCRVLNVTPARLEEAVKAAGHSAKNVREWLAEQPQEVDPQDEGG